MTQPCVEISVVIATCSRAAMLEQALVSIIPQLESFTAAGTPCELIVLDDGSTDSTPELLGQLQRTASVTMTIVRGERRGVAAARNLAAVHASGTWLASFDDDQLAQPDWLAQLHATALRTGAACVGGALQLHLPPGHTVESLGPRTRSILGEHLISQDVCAYPRGTRPATNNVLIRRDVFVHLGGYDATFTEGAEDADFFDRVEAGGHQLWFQPAAQALHLIPSSRLEPRNLRWTSLRIGAGDARLQQRKSPVTGLLKLAAVRMAVTLLRDLPLIAWSTLRHDARTRLDTFCSLWYTQGLLLATPAILRGRSDSAFLQSLNFRTRNGERPPAP